MKEKKIKSVKLYSEELMDPVTEVHYAFHSSLKHITTKHYHNFYEIFLVVEGEVIHVINNNSQRLTEGTLVFIRPNDIHYYKKSNYHKCKIINLAFKESLLKELINYLSEGFPAASLLKSDMPAQIILTKQDKEILVNKLQELNVISRQDKKIIKTRLRILLFDIFTKYFINNIHDGKNLPRWLEELINEIQKRENFIIGIKKLFELSPYTKEHLIRMFKKYLNKTPTEFINELKLNYAANLLSNTDESIITISMEAGFENLSHFYHIFKKHYNTSPAKFRQQHQKVSIPSK
ncbi:AraC family transcriptional regulator [Ignavibacteria bacterium 4148-Me]|uniref:AraC family transcriptional regulator n=1 Tax=Rosettibacter primus TaxID=3111523 RepID=UPI00336C2084